MLRAHVYHRSVADGVRASRRQDQTGLAAASPREGKPVVAASSAEEALPGWSRHQERSEIMTEMSMT